MTAALIAVGITVGLVLVIAAILASPMGIVFVLMLELQPAQTQEMPTVQSVFQDLDTAYDNKCWYIKNNSTCTGFYMVDAKFPLSEILSVYIAYNLKDPGAYLDYLDGTVTGDPTTIETPYSLLEMNSTNRTNLESVFWKMVSIEQIVSEDGTSMTIQPHYADVTEMYTLYSFDGRRTELAEQLLELEWSEWEEMIGS